MLVSEVIENFKIYINQMVRDSEIPEAVEQLILFGSYARNEADIYSDVDVAVVADETFTRTDKSNLRSYLEAFDKTIEISLFCTNKKKLEQVTDEFDANYWIKREGVLLWKK